MGLLFSRGRLAQFYFGLYESKAYDFATSGELFAATTPMTYATVYRNQVWGDLLIPVANMSAQSLETSLALRSPSALGVAPEQDYLVLDVLRRTAKSWKGSRLAQAFDKIAIPAGNLRLFCVRPLPSQVPYHLWGGKRISEVWDAAARKLTVSIQGPAGLTDTVFLGGTQGGIRQVLVGGKPVAFAYDPVQGLVHGEVAFTAEPVQLEVLCSPDVANTLPEKAVSADPLAAVLTE